MSYLDVYSRSHAILCVLTHHYTNPKHQISFTFSHLNSSSSLPKCPYAAVFRMMGRRRSSSFTMTPGLRLNVVSTIFGRSRSATPFLLAHVPWVSTCTEMGWDTPIAYESCTVHRAQ